MSEKSLMHQQNLVWQVKDSSVSPDSFESVATVLLDRLPFRTFTIKLKCGDLLEIDHALALHLVEGVAVFSSPGSIPIMFDFDSVSQVIDAPASDVPDGSSR